MRYMAVAALARGSYTYTTPLAGTVIKTHVGKQKMRYVKF